MHAEMQKDFSCVVHPSRSGKFWGFSIGNTVKPKFRMHDCFIDNIVVQLLLVHPVTGNFHPAYKLYHQIISWFNCLFFQVTSELLILFSENKFSEESVLVSNIYQEQKGYCIHHEDMMIRTVNVRDTSSLVKNARHIY